MVIALYKDTYYQKKLKNVTVKVDPEGLNISFFSVVF